MTQGAPLEGTVAQRIRQVRGSLAPGELRVVAALTDGYPTAGLVPIAQLAAEAKVSAPTALRLVSKLGFAGYGAFQEALRDEVQTRLFSPVTVYPAPGNSGHDAGNGSAGDSVLADAASLYTEGVRATINNLSRDDLAVAVAALADADRRVMLLGGRFTSVLAAELHQYLRMLRPGVVLVPASSADRMAAMTDVDDRTVAVLFDYRRYQQTTIEWGLRAAERGAELVLITDVYLSPLASQAAAVLTTSHTGPGPFDSMAHGFILIELLISLVVKELGEPARDRLADFEEMQLAEERERRLPRKG
ncbi:MurR/RpiR family transcriptional regulator [Gordonia sp. zg691]|uniref:MurR/RpiR family transcriptional regulator n=1 Tax=Gordonia jinghuaiqii TaxID=2758710 RepID=A0A7D7QXS8_9ACTN|nr:MurR/RpiR family transcriptional regulator [Gordonia jinghuaiqii]MBD0860688.1 MurR/RpiR family transcriptional regulator [Gordonia jinghuaiqii]MCR5978047.1 SIS domain-containing protein [Gordonia jinghuaiqii]QMT01488.1 MurR/RpiR family transcriptional regulator [Gordonia jinghuaiqii]